MVAGYCAAGRCHQTAVGWCCLPNPGDKECCSEMLVLTDDRGQCVGLAIVLRIGAHFHAYLRPGPEHQFLICSYSIKCYACMTQEFEYQGKLPEKILNASNATTSTRRKSRCGVTTVEQGVILITPRLGWSRSIPAYENMNHYKNHHQLGSKSPTQLFATGLKILTSPATKSAIS